MDNKHLHIELFAGCGGMGLGMEAAGFDLFFANELSPMASETFAYNLLHENLEKLASENKIATRTLWIKSAFTPEQLKNRLRENPFEARENDISDLTEDTDFDKKLLVGDIVKLLDWLKEHPATIERLKAKEITLISGGPPCQSFSLAGKREKNNAKNQLPWSFAEFAGLLQPKFILLENVKGITAPFLENGKKYYAWFEVAKAFALQGYVPVSMLLNSKYFGVAQNRPRFILLAIRQDIATQLLEQHQDTFLTQAIAFYKLVNNNEEDTDSIGLDQLKYYDIEDEEDKKLYNGFIFPAITTPEGKFISAAEAIGDLKRTDGIKSYDKSRVVYRDTLKETFPSPFQPNGVLFYNHEPRGHGYEVRARFRLYQIINEFQNGNKKNAADFIVGKDISDEALDKLLNEVIKYDVYFDNGGDDGYYKKPASVDEAKKHLLAIRTKKHSQRALKEDEPAPAQLTIPDDICHYDSNQLRTLTVREMARFQSFPDWYVFRSKVTTGGTNRKFEVPQYTQVGNAVPPLLAKALGESIINILKEVEN